MFQAFRNHRRLQEEEHMEPPLQKWWKPFCRKTMVFPKGLFFAATFPKIVKNSIFLLKFYQKFSKISQNFPTCVFRPNMRKINALFAKYFWKYTKIMHFINFLKKFSWKISKILRRPIVWMEYLMKFSIKFSQNFCKLFFSESLILF